MPLEPFETEGNLAEDFGLFEAAVHARPLELERHALRQLLLLLDGSNQDATARLTAEGLAAVTGAAVRELSGLAAPAEVLRMVREVPADLLILPAPFGRDYLTLRDESLGSVVDLLLLEAPCPVLCVRAPLEPGEVSTALGDVLVPVHVPAPEANRAAGWALSLLGQGGQLELLAVADRQLVQEALALLGRAVSPEALQPENQVRLVTEAIGDLTAALQRAGPGQSVAVHVEVQEGDAGAVVLSAANARPRLLVVAAPRQHTAPAFHRAVDLVLGARGPVLVV